MACEEMELASTAPRDAPDCIAGWMDGWMDGYVKEFALFGLVWGE